MLWGPEWAYSVFAPHLDRARSELCTVRANTDRPAPFHRAFMLAAQEAGYPLLDTLDDPDEPVGVAPFSVNIVDGVRWNAAFAYLDAARPRANLTVDGGALVDRVMIERGKATGVVLAGRPARRGAARRAGCGCVPDSFDPRAQRYRSRARPSPARGRSRVGVAGRRAASRSPRHRHGLAAVGAPSRRNRRASQRWAAVSASRPLEDGEQLLYCGKLGYSPRAVDESGRDAGRV